MWFKHLVTVADMRKKGSKKAAEPGKRTKRLLLKFTRELTKQKLFVVHVSLHTDSTCTTVIKHWICCDKCGSWFHYRCVGIEFVPERFFCGFCK